MPSLGLRPGKRVFIETYGCQMNLADSELMGGILSTRGYGAASSLEEADVILINTCAVRERAEERVFGRLSYLLRYKHERPEIVLGVTGCMAERMREDIITRAPYVDLVIGPDAYRRLPELLEKCQLEESDPVIDVRLDKEETYEGLVHARQAGVGGWITVQRGCDKFCSFCIVPFVRGRERGVSPGDILRQCQELAERGFKEVTLLGQTVNSYKHEGLDFSDLLLEVAKVDGLERIRFTSPYPIDFTPKLIETMATTDKICKYLHLPVQSGSDAVLERMRRGYTVAQYHALVEQIREAMPGIAMSTDVIVGFPGESEEDYEQTLALLQSVRYDFAYLFKYSEREGTHAARKLPEDVLEDEKGRRLRHLIEVQEAISQEIFTGLIGQTYQVLVEGPSKRDQAQYCGRTDAFKMTVFDLIEGMELAPGQLVDVRITDATSHTLRGQMVIA
ncbi:MAG: tRNA (N6-isopentenyl adenosine(37)-C2)-methylthiotransferase MiaB [Bradymonadaceae bacterium]|nr:tRNA (N6-isopentenyl adenosine(37)-C2)-methylthiotransferase MiaB [Lujinxingiaceae bacterium]